MYIMQDMQINNKCIDFIINNILIIYNNMLVKILLINMELLELIIMGMGIYIMELLIGFCILINNRNVYNF